jgi:hypothetical protein
MEYENRGILDKTPFLTAINTEYLTYKGFASFMCRVSQGLNNE